MKPGIVAGATFLAMAFGCSSEEESPNKYSFKARVAESNVNHSLIATSDASDRPLLETDMAWTELEAGVRSLAEGSNTPIEITLSWQANGQTRELSLDEFLSTAVRLGNEGVEADNTLDMSVAGNNADTAATMPGHRACLTVCPYGVVTNAGLPMSAMESHTFGVRSGVRSALPEKGSAVQVTMGIRGGVRSGVRLAPPSRN
ncbi:MAG: hypothetical protein HYY13_14085 [Nitrospirae bacterium]|nr:hypothetical protein [Nitrospirota bacterium]